MQTHTTASYLASLGASKLNRVLAKLSPALKALALYDWKHWARPKQLAPPGDWVTWVLLCGRGFGKTRTGAEWFRAKAENAPNGSGILVAQTPGDARDVMIKGRSGLLSVCPPWNRPDYEPSNLTLTWPNGCIAHIRSAHNPEKVRGLGGDFAWVDELAAWPSMKGRETWDNLMMGMREGENPQVCVTTTPKPIPLIRELIDEKFTVVTEGSSYENRDNLAPKYFDKILAKYEGTNLGLQEIYGKLLDQMEGALWTRSLIDKYRVKEAPQLVRAVVGVDPTGGVAETGIVGAGLAANGHVYIICDVSSKGSPGEWGRAVVEDAYNKFEMDLVVGEKNYGGTMVKHTVQIAARDLGLAVRYKDVPATRGKIVRAEPVVALYEQGRVHHVGVFPQLEGEMTMWRQGDPSPNRLNACVWAVTELAVDALKPVQQVEANWG